LGPALSLSATSQQIRKYTAGSLARGFLRLIRPSGVHGPVVPQPWVPLEQR